MYRDAEAAFESLANLLAESKTGWFFDSEHPSLFDASVFAYTMLCLDDGTVAGMTWGNDRIGRIVKEAGAGNLLELVRHKDRIWERCWGTSGDWRTLGDRYRGGEGDKGDQDSSDGDDVNFSWRDGDDGDQDQDQDSSWIDGRDSEWREKDKGGGLQGEL